MLRTHREVETKFDANDSVIVERLEDIDVVAATDGPATQDLVALYVDTADLRLLRAGIGLRRRVGGDDAGWHLKIEKPLSERIEVHRPLGHSSQVPKALRDLVTVHVRDRDLAPVAQLRTTRRVHRVLGATGTVLAEVADDVVEGSTPVNDDIVVWREIEVELAVDGDRDLLAAVGDHLVSAGATPSAARSKLARLLGSCTPPRPQAKAFKAD